MMDEMWDFYLAYETGSGDITQIDDLVEARRQRAAAVTEDTPPEPEHDDDPSGWCCYFGTYEPDDLLPPESY